MQWVPNKLDELGNQLIKLADIVPNGMVVFFVSYDYMDKVVNHFKKTNILNRLNEKKTVSEPFFLLNVCIYKTIRFAGVLWAQTLEWMRQSIQRLHQMHSGKFE